MAIAVNERPLDVDVLVVGAGMGGIYAIHKFAQSGLNVVGVEAASGVGGVWFHNRYPGARVDVESLYYAFLFSEEIVRDWKWTERYAAQPEIERYLDFVAERTGVKERIQFNTAVTAARWVADADHYEVELDTGEALTTRFLYMATGQLSVPRELVFEGLEDFRGRWVQTAHWPDEPVDLSGRVGVVGTGSTGVQVITTIAPEAQHLYVFQRTANYAVPAHNGPFDQAASDRMATDLEETRQRIRAHGSGSLFPDPRGPYDQFGPEERKEVLEERWALGGQMMNRVFTDQGTNQEANEAVAEFVRSKISSIVTDPKVAALLMPVDYPIGTRRLAVDTGYYETFNRPNVTLVDVKSDPIVRITETGIQTRDNHYELDTIVFATGFVAFFGALDRANIRNERGESPSDLWKRGPRTFLGLMTVGFPNMFLPTGPGSPSVLSNMLQCNVVQADFVADIIGHMRERNLTRVEPTAEAQDEWTAHVAQAASKLIRLNVNNYMVHVNEDGSRVFQPYAGGFSTYVQEMESVKSDGFQGFSFQ